MDPWGDPLGDPWGSPWGSLGGSMGDPWRTLGGSSEELWWTLEDDCGKHRPPHRHQGCQGVYTYIGRKNEVCVHVEIAKVCIHVPAPKSAVCVKEQIAEYAHLWFKFDFDTISRYPGPPGARHNITISRYPSMAWYRDIVTSPGRGAGGRSRASGRWARGRIS